MGNMSARVVLSGIALVMMTGCGDVYTQWQDITSPSPVAQLTINPFAVQLSCLSQPGMKMSCYVQGFRNGEVWTSHIKSTSWDFGDGTTATGVLTISHTYSGGWMYNIGVTATDDAGEQNSQLITMYAFN